MRAIELEKLLLKDGWFFTKQVGSLQSRSVPTAIINTMRSPGRSLFRFTPAT